MVVGRGKSLLARDRCSRFRQARKVETRFPLSFSFPARTSGVTVGGCIRTLGLFSFDENGSP